MNALKGLAWIEARQVAPDALAALGFATLGSLAAHAAEWLRGGPDAQQSLEAFATFVALPAAGVLLGATMTSGNGTLGFLRELPTRWELVGAVRLGVRVTAFVTVLLATCGLAALARTLGDAHEGALLDESGTNLAAWSMLWLGGSAVAAGWCRRPVPAVIGGLALGIAALAVLRTGWASSRTTLVATPALGGMAALLLVLAAAVTVARDGAEPLRARRTVRLAVTLTAAPAGVLAVALLLCHAAALVLADRAEAAWEAAGGPLAAVPEAHPRAEANASALRLEVLVRRLGFSITPKAARNRATEAPAESTGARAATWRSARRELGPWLESALAEPTARVAPPPEAVAAYLAAARADLEAVRRHLLDAPPPRWAVDVDRGPAAPVPNLVGHLHLGRLLAAAALEAALTGDRELAHQDLRAGFRLAASLRHRPESISVLLALPLAKYQAVALRKIGGEPEDWAAELDAAAYRASLGSALQADARAWIRFARAETPSPDADLSEWLTSPLRRAATADDLRRAAPLAAIASDASACEAVLVRSGPWPPALSPVSRLGVLPPRLGDLTVQLELTRLVLESAGPAGAAVPVPGSCAGIEFSVSETEVAVSQPLPAWLRELRRDTTRDWPPVRFVLRAPAAGDR